MKNATARHLSDKHVLLWSATQKSFHQQTYREMQEMNLRAFARGTKSDWILLTIGTTDEVEAFYDTLLDTAKKRKLPRSEP